MFTRSFRLLATLALAAGLAGCATYAEDYDGYGGYGGYGQPGYGYNSGDGYGVPYGNSSRRATPYYAPSYGYRVEPRHDRRRHDWRDGRRDRDHDRRRHRRGDWQDRDDDRDRHWRGDRDDRNDRRDRRGDDRRGDDRRDDRRAGVPPGAFGAAAPERRDLPEGQLWGRRHQFSQR